MEKSNCEWTLSSMLSEYSIVLQHYYILARACIPALDKYMQKLKVVDVCLLPPSRKNSRTEEDKRRRKWRKIRKRIEDSRKLWKAPRRVSKHNFISDSKDHTKPHQNLVFCDCDGSCGRMDSSVVGHRFEFLSFHNTFPLSRLHSSSPLQLTLLISCHPFSEFQATVLRRIKNNHCILDTRRV